ncbi:MAG: DUF3048 domain-containing protein [Chloroflexi bacterium]|nr:DUF3048 domain-containing protein [Chloroflexota bacterium]
MLKPSFVCLLIALAVFSAACGASETPTPQPTPRPTPTAAPTQTPTQTPAPTPTPTPLPTPLPTLAPTATTDPTADLCPLTGVRDTKRLWQTRRPLAVKIDNSPSARPQTGLSSADLIVEHLAEGGVTRFDAVFWCAGETAGAESVGPVRSARLIDLELAPMLQAVLVHVGASNEVLGLIRATLGKAGLDGDVDRALLHRTQSREAPYNAYISLQEIWNAATQRGVNQAGLAVKGLTFGDTAPTGGQPASQIVIPYDKRFSDSTWVYAPERKTYQKAILGQPVVDTADNEPVQAANVIVVFAPHTLTDIIEDSLGSRSICIDLSGRGRALIFRDGQAYEAQWVRADPNALIRYVDSRQQEIVFRPGASWLEVAPVDLKVEWK